MSSLEIGSSSLKWGTEKISPGIKELRRRFYTYDLSLLYIFSIPLDSPCFLIAFFLIYFYLIETVALIIKNDFLIMN